jgi:hypothetical protein
MEKYNGWTNYATWRINLEILSDIEFDGPIHASDLEDIVEDVVFANETAKGLIEDYARAFLADVNYYEIAEIINENNK